MSATAYPLSWPAGWPRTTNRWPPRYGFKNNTFVRARDSLGLELERLGAHEVVLSTNVPLNISGQPRGDYRDLLGDPGVAVYFELRKRPMAMARDAYPAVSDNLRSLALAIEYLRGLERHGGANMVERAFTGFAALPAPMEMGGPRHWSEVLADEEVFNRQPSNEAEVEAIFKRLALKRHPDHGGSDEAMAELLRARDEALRDLTTEVA